MRNFVTRTVAAAIALGATVFSGAAPAAADNLDEQRVREIVEQMLRERPEIIVEALTAYQAKQELEKEQRQRDALAAKSRDLFHRAGDPFVGNADAPITVVEFFDYRCGYCKRVLNDVMAVASENDDVKVVFKEFPILGEASVMATRVSLAVNIVAPEKYAEFHKRAMGGRGSYNEESLLQLVDALGISPDEVKAQMDSAEVNASIRANYELAEQLGIRGTPAFVIGDQVVPGAISRSALQKLIEQQRG